MLLTRRNSLFDEMFNDPFFERPFDNISTQIMKTDVHEKDGNYLMEMELPGYAKEDITADLKDGYLVINAEKNTTDEEKDEKGNCIRCERYSGSCQRSFYVGKDVTQDDIKASFSDGVLRLIVPNKEQQQIETPSRIMIE